MHGFEENDQKLYFWAKMANFQTKKGSKTSQKMAKNAKTRIFPETKLPLNDLKSLSTVSDRVS